MKNNLATTYWEKIGELEKQLVRAFRKIDKLEKENKKLRDENVEVKMENDQLKQHLFGKKKKDDNDEEGFVSLRKKEKKTPKRSPKSYRRSMPKKEEITEKNEYSVGSCPDCGGELSKEKSLKRWIEDIPPFFDQPQKTVTHELIHSGYCLRCQKRHYGKDTNIQGQSVTIGNNVKPFILYCIYIQNMSWQKTIDLMISSLIFTDSKSLMEK